MLFTRQKYLNYLRFQQKIFELEQIYCCKDLTAVDSSFIIITNLSMYQIRETYCLGLKYMFLLSGKMGKWFSKSSSFS